MKRRIFQRFAVLANQLTLGLTLHIPLCYPSKQKISGFTPEIKLR